MSGEAILRVAADVQDLTKVLAFVGELLDRHGCPPKTRTSIRTAMEEMFVNIALYAYPDGAGWAEIRGCVEEGVACFKLIDGGTPFDPLASADPDVLLSGEERGIGGLGIFMVKKQMDEMSYAFLDGCNVLTMKKHL